MVEETGKNLLEMSLVCFESVGHFVREDDQVLSAGRGRFSIGSNFEVPLKDHSRGILITTQIRTDR